MFGAMAVAVATRVEAGVPAAAVASAVPADGIAAIAWAMPVVKPLAMGPVAGTFERIDFAEPP